MNTKKLNVDEFLDMWQDINGSINYVNYKKFAKDYSQYILNKTMVSLIDDLQSHWDKHGDSTHWEGIKMAKRVIKSQLKDKGE